MQTTKKSLSKNQMSSVPKEEKRTKLDLIKISVFVVTILGILLALLGYGYKLGIASTFGYSPLELVNSSSDFLYDASVPLMIISAKVLKLSFWIDLFLSDYIVRIVAALTSTWLFVYLFVRYIISSHKRKKAAKKWFDSFEEYSSYLDRAVFNDGFVKGFIRVLITTPIYAYLGFILIFVSVSILLTAIITVPMMGYTEGRKIAKDHVMNASGCAPLNFDENKQEANNKSKKADKKANCVAIIQDGKEVVRGRVIAENSQRIYLYVKEYREKQKTVRVTKTYPTRNAMIVQVDTEDVPSE